MISKHNGNVWKRTDFGTQMDRCTANQTAWLSCSATWRRRNVCKIGNSCRDLCVRVKRSTTNSIDAHSRRAVAYFTKYEKKENKEIPIRLWCQKHACVLCWMNWLNLLLCTLAVMRPAKTHMNFDEFLCLFTLFFVASFQPLVSRLFAHRRSEFRIFLRSHKANSD